MSIKNPNWYELPKTRWEERTNTGERAWRDSQRQKLYDAESYFRNTLWEDQYKEFASLKEAQAYADKFLKSAWVERRWGKQEKITIGMTSSGDAYAQKYRKKIMLPDSWGLNEVVLLHELCHIVHPRGTGVAHGRYFARAFLEAIGHKLGAGAKKAVRKLYIKNHVKCTPRPVYSQEAKNKMRNRGREMAMKYFTNATCFQF